jgi:murein DD-endopeptidase MepM/ murein hydrolase activator NlpD
MCRKIVSFFLIFLVCGLSLPRISFAAPTAEDLQQQINNTNNQIQALDAEIKQYENQIAQTSQQSNTLSNTLKQLTLTRSKLLAERDQTQKKINATGLVISGLNTTISTEQNAITDSRESLSKLLYSLYQRDQTAFIEQMISTTTLADASREYNNIITLNSDIHGHIVDLSNHLDELNISVNKKQQEQSSLTELKKTLDQKQLAVGATQKEKNTLLAETKNSEAAYKKLLADRIKARDAFEKSLESYESQLKFILNPSLLPTSGSGTLSWPLDNVFITQLFGKTVAAKRLYTSGSHSGVDFRASTGTPVKSMGTGIVMGTGDTDLYCKGASFGKWVFIKYNNGLSSTFGHLSVIQATTGQNVVAGDIVGLSGSTGHVTGPHLHVTVYASEGASVKTVPSLSCAGKTFIMPIAPTNAYLDPMVYLPKISSSSVKNDYQKD